MLSQGGDGGSATNVVDWLRERWGRPFVGLVHRLDRNTSGLMVVAQRTKAARRLTESLQQGDIRRSYLGGVMGRIAQPGTWKHSLKKDSITNTVRVHPSGSPAALSFRPLGSSEHHGQPITWVEFTLETGRSHQIRVQASHEGFPLLGDQKYGGAPFERMALHSWKLEFPYPVQESRTLFFTDAPPQEFDFSFLTKR